jgi:tetratricopeptide (TPR) repeat protein
MTFHDLKVASCQTERALNSFQKSFDHERSNYSALYGIAYCYIASEPEKAKTLFYQYLEMAPNCDKQFPNAYYMLATLFVEEQIFHQFVLLIYFFHSQKIMTFHDLKVNT